MVILHATAPAAVGGLERVVHALAAGHHARGQSVHVAAVTTDPAVERAFLDPLAAEGVTVHPLRLGARAYGAERAAVAGLCDTLRPDVVHTHGYRSDVVDAGVARARAIPTVSTVHGFTRGSWRNRLYEWVQRRTLRRFDRVVVASRAIYDELRQAGVPEDRLVVLRNAWREATRVVPRAEARAALDLPDDGFLIGWVGRVSAEKGPDVLVAALARLASPWRAAVLGDGPERHELAARAAALGLSPRLTWHGIVPNAARLYTAFDVLVLSSRTEGTPITLLEAMAAGVPVVATSVGGIPDVVTPAEALLVPPEDAGALANAIAAVRQDPAAATVRARAARARLAEAFAVEPWLSAYEDVYRAAQDRAGRGRA